MDELVANFELSEGQEFDALFEIYASGTTWGNIDGNISNQIDLKDALDSKASNTRVDEIVNTYDYEIGNINIDITSINDTLQSYGNIVTHDVADFATSAQGALADTALQPNDNITELVNNAGYITSADLPTLADLTTTAQLNAINSGITTSGVSQITTNTNNIANIENLIPVQATSSNQLADKNFVNSSIATNTANFIGTFNSLAELEAYTGPLTNNDYAFVATTDTAGNTLYDRYKYNATEGEWLFEYELNNSSFTANQWAAINSGITSGDVALIATAVQPSDLATVATTGAYSDLTGAPTVNNATITLTQGGVSKGTFTLNQSNDATINLDAGGGGAVDSVNGQTGDVVLTASDVGALPNTTNIPSKTSDLTNDSGYITNSALSDYATETYVNDGLATKQDVLTAGTDLEIVTGSGGDSTVSGTTSIALNGASANGLNSVTLTGACVQNGTPTPTTPVDIVCNNGVLKARHQSGLPLGYKLLDSVYNNGAAYLDLGTPIGSSDIITFDIMWNVISSRPFFGGYNEGGSYNRNSFVGTYVSNNNTKSFYINAHIVKVLMATENTRYLVKWNGINNYPTVNGVESETETLPYDSFTPNVNAFLGTRNQAGTPTLLDYITIFGFKVERGGVPVLNLVPVLRESDNEAGMFDLISGNFLLSPNEASFTAGNVVSDPIEIYTDGTVETVTDSNQSTATAEMLLSVGNYKDTQSILNGAVTRNVGVKILDGSEEWNAITNNRGYYLMINCVQDIYTKVYGICSHFNFYIWADNTTQMPDNNFGFNKSASTGITNGNITFKPNLTDIPTVEAWKAFLANEYVSGTPVIVVYPLATPTTETVTGQTLTTVQGNNTLTITQASIENLPIEANYNLQGGKIINFTNDSGYTTNEGTVTSVNNVQPDTNGNVTLNIDNAISTTSTNLVQNKAIPSYIVSRGENLVSNGFATLGNNYNFSTMTYTGADTYGAGGCFYYTNSSNGRVRSDEYMPIDITQSYKLSYAVKNTTLTSTYDFIDMYDIDFNRIAAGNCGFTAGTTTTLARDLKNGDTVIYFTDLSNWNTESTSQYLRALIFWKYKNSYGYEYPTEYYSRYWWYNLWDDSSVAIDKINNTITLKSAWNHGTFEAGHPVSQGTLSGANVYGNSNYQPTPNEWTVKTYTFDPSKYRNATAYIQLGWLTNYSNQTNNTFSVSSISFTSNVNLIDFVAYTASEVETLWGSI